MAAGTKIIATDTDIPKEIAAKVSKVSGRRFEVRKHQDIEPDRRKDVEVLFVAHSGLVNEKLFAEFPNVKMLQSMSAGVDALDFSSIPRNVIVCSNSGAYREPIAEHVFGMILLFAKHLDRNNQRMRAGKFESSNDGISLAGRTMGIVGAGGIGQSAAKIAKAFKMRTIGINTSGKPAPHFDAVWKMERLDDLLKQADFVLLSLPLNNHTRSLIDANRLKLMKESAILVNIARGPIISESDLYAHLKAHPDFKAGIDVWWRYPKKGEKFSPDFPFFELPNFVGSPHNAEGVPEATQVGKTHAFENILRYVKGQPPEWVVDKSNYKGFSRIPRP